MIGFGCDARYGCVSRVAALLAPDATYRRNDIENGGIPVDKGELLHHGLHAVTLMDRAAEVGLECPCCVPAPNVADPAGDGIVEFMLDRLWGR